ncbi:hypothetical protein CL630_01480 [bacterium]|nr:hypothetical protein [bacterium]|tara:strand:+ start:44 stop:1237 length:1194 start_codon:yes stop_codon:yes gene_type:complete
MSNKKFISPHRGIVSPLDLSSAFWFEDTDEAAKWFADPTADEYGYVRMGNPTVTRLEKSLANMEEGAELGSVWSENSGLTAVMHLLIGCLANRPFDRRRVVTTSNLYGGTVHQFHLWADKFGFDIVFVENPFDLSAWEDEINERTALVFAESPSNPGGGVVDIEPLAEIAHKVGAWLAVDNTLAGPIQKPLIWGADVVLYSSTKSLNGLSIGMGGVIIGSPKFVEEMEGPLNEWHSGIGTIMGPVPAFFTNLSVDEDVEEIMWRFSANALEVSHFLSEQGLKVHYPLLPESPYYVLAQKYMPEGAGGVLSFEMQSYEDAKRITETLPDRERTFLAPHLGDRRYNLIIHPASTTHSKLSENELRAANITPELVRLSVAAGRRRNNAFIDRFAQVLNQL